MKPQWNACMTAAMPGAAVAPAFAVGVIPHPGIVQRSVYLGSGRV